MMTDQTILTSFAKFSEDVGIRIAAIKNLTDQNILASIATDDSNEDSIRKMAIEKLNDLTALAYIMDTNKYTLGYLAERRYEEISADLTDQSALVSILRNMKNSSIRKIALKNMNIQAEIIDCAKNDSSAEVREAAIKKLTDHSILAYIAKNDSDRTVRAASLDKITDRSVLIEIAENDCEAIIRFRAFERLWKLKILSDDEVIYFIDKTIQYMDSIGPERLLGAIEYVLEPKDRLKFGFEIRNGEIQSEDDDRKPFTLTVTYLYYRGKNLGRI